MKQISPVGVTPPSMGYVPGPVERFGRKLKVEYLGMASVYSIIALLYFGDFALWYETVLSTLGAFFLFLGLKKKTEDHIVGSLVLFAAVSVAQAPVVVSKWVIPYLLFGVTVFVMEGYRERRPTRIYALPALLFGWSLADSSWWLGAVFSTMYLAIPRADKPHLRRHLSYILIAGFLLGFTGRAFVDRSIFSALQFHPDGHVSLGRLEVEMLAAMGIPALLCLAFYWKKLMAPHRWNTLIFAGLAPIDGRFAALFAMVAAVLLCATVFRDSVDSPSMRPFFKHLEWHYFWYVFAIAVWAYLNQWGAAAFSA